MAAFDKVEVTIRHDSWGRGEQVVIREPTYGNSTKMTKLCMGANGELDSVKYSDMLLPIVIVSWTFKRDGKDVPVTLENIRQLPASYVTFIAEKVADFAVSTDAEFPDET